MTERSADALLGALEELYADTGCVPTRSDVIYYDDELLGEIGSEFRTLERAVEASLIDQEDIFVRDLENVTDEIGRVPGKSEFERYGNHEVDQIMSYFGSWSNFLEATERTESEGREDRQGSSNEKRGSGSSKTESKQPAAEGDSEKREYLEEIRSLHEEADVVVSGKQMDLEGAYSVYELSQEFGSWDAAIEAAGIDKGEALGDEIRRVAGELDRPPERTDMDDHGRVSASMCSNFFGDWDSALESARNETELEVSRPSDDLNTSSPSREDYIQSLQELDERVDFILKPSKMRSDGSFSAQEIMQEFGSWDDALAAAGIDKGQLLREEIQRVASKLGRKPTQPDINEHGRCSAGMCARFFGSWSEALDQALGELSNTRDKSSTNTPESASRSDLLEDLQRIKRVINREPTKDDYVRLGNYGINDVEDRFGNWGSFLGTADIDHASPDRSSAEATWEDIPDNARLYDPITVKVHEVDRDPGPRKSTVLAVTEPSGRELPVNIWEKHPDPVQWEVGESYRLYNVRGTVWESNGSTRKLLDSTRDIEVESQNELPIGGNDDSTTRESETQADESDRIESLMDDMDDLL